MLAKRIIPCLDVKDGRVVKGIGFLNLRDAGDPVEIARFYDIEGADELCFLDITASHEKRNILLEVVERTAAKVFMPLTIGGGIRTLDDIRILLLAGADKVSINTAAVQNPDFVKKAVERFGSQCIVVAIDAKRTIQKPSPFPEPTRWKVYTHGGRQDTGLDVIQWARTMDKAGAGEILLTSMDRDGTKAGYDIELTRSVSEVVRIPVIASGGAGRLEHLSDVLNSGRADAVLAASIFHYKQYTILEAKKFLDSKGIKVRIP